MVAPAGKPAVARKRNRKRKRRATSLSSSSSSSSSDSSSDDEDDQATTTVKRTIPTPKAIAKPQESASESSSSSSSSSSSESESDSDVDKPITKTADVGSKLRENSRARRSPSPGPIAPSSVAIPSFMPSSSSGNVDVDAAQREQALRDKFRKLWMGSMAEGFKDDLEHIRKEPNFTTTKLSMLIDSLAAGAEVFSSSTNGEDELNEMEIVVE